MYEAFYGLTTRPFGKTPDPAFLFQSRGHAEALARMVTAAEERDLAVLSGDIGAGKTLLTRAIVDALAAGHGEAARVVLLVNPRLTPVELLSTLADRLGVDPLPRTKPKLLDAILEALYRINEVGGFCLLIVDEAHLLPNRAVFEELRLLLNLTLDDQPLLGMLLVGQEELRSRLGKKDLRSFAQRIGAGFHLRALGADEVGPYLAHRLAVAGREEPLFTDGAVAVLAQASAGVPRRLNVLAQASLLVGYGLSAQRIGEDIVRDVWDDLRAHLAGAFDGGA
jgi:type II secretory pathway predicted ATPase ExeA